jgi:hypothetical protein
MSEAIGPVAVIPCDGVGPLLSGVDEVSPDTPKLDDQARAASVDGYAVAAWS